LPNRAALGQLEPTYAFAELALVERDKGEPGLHGRIHECRRTSIGVRRRLELHALQDPLKVRVSSLGPPARCPQLLPHFHVDPRRPESDPRVVGTATAKHAAAAVPDAPITSDLGFTYVVIVQLRSE